MASIQSQLHDINEKLDNYETGINIFFLLMNSIFVFFMQGGFAFLEGGSVRAKNTTNILIKNVFDSATSAFIFWAVGYAFGFGGGKNANAMIGDSQFFLNNTTPVEYAFFFFQYVFAAASGTIVSGALSERAQTMAYITFATVMVGFIYPVVAHWIFSPAGWLNHLNFIDRAGSTVIHVTAGTAALVGAKILGARIGRFTKSGKIIPIPGHSTVLTTIGYFMLLFGFFSFNGISEGFIVGGEGDPSERVAFAVINTGISAACASLTVCFVMKIGYSKTEILIFSEEYQVVTFLGGSWSIIQITNAGLGGAIAMCSGCSIVAAWAACVIGICSGFAYMVGDRIILRILRVDDPVCASAVHLACGMWGTFATSLFALPHQLPQIENGGVLYAWDWPAFVQMGIQVMGVAVVFLWSGSITAVIFFILKGIGYLRVCAETEEEGLDFRDGDPAYPIDVALLSKGDDSGDDDGDEPDE